MPLKTTSKTAEYYRQQGRELYDMGAKLPYLDNPRRGQQTFIVEGYREAAEADKKENKAIEPLLLKRLEQKDSAVKVSLEDYVKSGELQKDVDKGTGSIDKDE